MNYGIFAYYKIKTSNACFLYFYTYIYIYMYIYIYIYIYYTCRSPTRVYIKCIQARLCAQTTVSYSSCAPSKTLRRARSPKTLSASKAPGGRAEGGCAHNRGCVCVQPSVCAQARLCAQQKYKILQNLQQIQRI